MAIVFHALLLCSALLIPKYFNTRPRIPEFTSVDLVNISEILPQPAPPEPSAVQQGSPPPSKIKKEPLQEINSKNNVPAAPVIEPIPEVAAKPISLKPMKRKLKKDIDPANDPQEARKKLEEANRIKLQERQRLLEEQSRQLQQEANRQKAIADAAAAIAAQEALNALKQSLRADAVKDAITKTTTRPARRSGGSSSAVEAQYFSSIFAHLHQYWSLPDIKQWDPEMTAIVVIEIGRNGKILNQYFEKNSGDRVFDQFVSRAIEEADPLPAIPTAINEQQYTLGLRFKPGKIQ